MSSDQELSRMFGRHAEPQADDTEQFEPLTDDAEVDGAEVDGAEVDGAEVLDDPFADDLDQQLAARAPQRWVNRGTVVLAGLLLLVGGFLAGAQVQKHFGATTGGRAGQNQNAGGNGAFAGGGGFQRGGGQNGGDANGQTTSNVRTGTVKLVDGSTVYIQTPDGQVLTVRTNGSTAVQVTQPGALSDLTPGTQVSVEGPAGSDGAVTATKVSRTK
jgi:hypothetical protein